MKNTDGMECIFVHKKIHFKNMNNLVIIDKKIILILYFSAI